MGRSLVVTGVAEFIHDLMYDWPYLTDGERHMKVQEMEAAMQQDEVLAAVFKACVLTRRNGSLPTPSDMEGMIDDIVKTGVAPQADLYRIRR